jgi:anti-sigma regulatory factor (Ser/Thr protein kinase)
VPCAESTVSIRIPSDPKHLYLMRRLVQEISLAHGFSEEEVRRIVLAMDEACTNVIRYAYEGDSEQAIDIEAGPVEDGVRFVVIDYGRKPDPDAIAPRALHEVRPGGLGTHFIREVMDEVAYDTSGERGTRLSLVKRRKPAAPAAEGS